MLAAVLLHPLVLAQTTLTFTNAAATGRYGPTQSQVNTAYDGTTLDDAVTINTQGIQEWTVPATGTYTIEVWGAQGGNGQNTTYTGGQGARMKGDFTLSAGDVLKILVGQQGSTSAAKAGGGGGGTQGDVIDDPFVVTGIPFEANGTTEGFNDDYDEVCPYTGSTSNDVVYMFSTSGGTYDFSLCESGYDTKIYIYDVNQVNIACNDDACNDSDGNPWRSLLEDVPL